MHFILFLFPFLFLFYWRMITEFHLSIHILSNTFVIQLQSINDLDFHPQNTVMLSGAKDHVIKYEFF